MRADRLARRSGLQHCRWNMESAYGRHIGQINSFDCGAPHGSYQQKLGTNLCITTGQNPQAIDAIAIFTAMPKLGTPHPDRNCGCAPEPSVDALGRFERGMPRRYHTVAIHRRDITVDASGENALRGEAVRGSRRSLMLAAACGASCGMRVRLLVCDGTRVLSSRIQTGANPA
jgi:hypothetical protein